MAIDLTAHRGESGFPVDHPLDALKADHNLVRQLFDRCLNSQDISERSAICAELLMRLDMHMSMEEGAFYPSVREVDLALVDQCEAEHEAAKQLMDELRAMDLGDPQAEDLFRQLADGVRSHLDTEEQQLFPKLQQAKLDLPTIGIDMQAFESSLLAAQGQAAQRPGVRP